MTLLLWVLALWCLAAVLLAFPVAAVLGGEIEK